MDVTNLILNLKSKITDQTLDQQMVSKAIRLLELGTVNQVSSFAALPTPSVTNSGQLYYVLYDGLYWSTGDNWWPIVQTQFDLAYAWGNNNTGRLGDNTITNRSSPVIVVGRFSDWCQISAGGYHSVAVRFNGTAWSWGRNAQGQLGDQTTTNRSSPVSVMGGISNWCSISAGDAHTVAITTSGTAWTWGFNTDGRLGDNTTTSRSSPVSVTGGFSDWCQASAGNSHTVAVRTSGSAWSWGANTCGMLGDNTTTNRSSPVSVVGGFSDWCQVSTGIYHSVAVRSSGSAWAWGYNTQGQLGNNSTTSRSSPVSVVGGFSDWCQVSAGSVQTVAVRSSGSAWAWGLNSCGILGDNTTNNTLSPVVVAGGFTDWCQVSAGGGVHTVAVRSSGTSWAWGSNTCGQLGENTTVNKSSPVSVVGGFSDWCQASAGGTHSLAIRNNTL